MNWYKLANTDIIVNINMSNYSSKMNSYLSSLVKDPLDDNSFNQIKNMFAQSIDIFIKDVPKYNDILSKIKNSVISNNFNKRYVYERLWKMRDEIGSYNFDLNRKYREILRYYYQIEEHLSDSYFTEDKKNELLQSLLSQTYNNMNKLANILKASLSNVVNFKGKFFPITILAETDDDYNTNSISIDEGSKSALLYVGDPSYYIYMTVFLNGEKIDIVGDEVEDFNELENEFGQTVNEIKPFYNLIRMVLKNPNFLDKKEKTITVYTARPVKDFNTFENATDIPVDIFVSSNYNFVEGFAIDNKPRDIWKIRISDIYLMTDETNNPNMTFQIYSRDGGTSVPIKGIQLINRIE